MKTISFITLLALAVPAMAEKPQKEPALPEFVQQVLEPTGGKIKRPKAWFYTEDHNAHSYTWIISKEDAKKGNYDTGVRIQTLVGVRAGTGVSPREFVMHFIESKKKSGAKVIKSIEERKEGLFTRVGLETEEGAYHILYSAFWGNDNLDVVVVSTAGAKKEEWGKYAGTFDAMSEFELIDMARFDKPEPAVKVEKGQLLGHWRYTDEEAGVTSDYTFKEDGTFTSNIAQGGKVTWEMEGKWALDGNVVNYELTKSSVEQVPAGTKDHDAVLEITKEYYVIMPTDGHKRKFARVP